MDIHHSLIKDFVMPRIKSVVVTDYYGGIQGALASREDFPYDDFLAKPRLRTQTAITWATDVFGDKPTPLTDLTGELRERYAGELKKRIEAVERLIASLKEEPDGAPLADILQKAIAYIDDDSVYCGDGKVVLVNWGLIPRRPGLGNGSIYRNGKFVGVWGHAKAQVAPKVSPVMASPVVEEPKPVATVRTERPIPEPTHEPATKAEPVHVDEPKPMEEPDPMAPPSVSHEPTPMREEPEPVAKEEPGPVAKEEPSRGGGEPSPEIGLRKATEKERHGRDKEAIGDWRSSFSALWKALAFFLRKLWWLMALLAVMFLTLFLCRDCQGPISKINPYYSPLPKTPRLLPIETDKVGNGVDGLSYVATDRLNVLLDKGDYDNMLKWATAFKKAYPGGDYGVYYYNTDLSLLQIKVPVDKQKEVMMELPDKLKDFSFSVFYESVSMTKGGAYDDPDFSDATRSWYMRAINVYDAWSTTMGSEDVVVAVVDNGFDLSHPELRGKTVDPYNVMTQDDDIHPVYVDGEENPHGTHVAATAVGNINNGTGLSGVAPKCRLMPIQVAADGSNGRISNQAILEGVLYAVMNGADVVNVSLGMYAPDQVKRMSEAEQLNVISTQLKYEEMLWNRVVEIANEHNCTLVLAAGNDNVISGIDPNKRNPSTIRVSAVTPDLQKASFSNYGCYPNLRREYSTVSAPGVAIYNAAPHGQYASLQGTSMASPVVAGLVALLKSENRSLTTEQIIEILKRTGRKVNPSIGPVVNAANAMNVVTKGGSADGGCDAIARRIRQLRAEIDSLTQLCPGAKCSSDTLKYSDAVGSQYGLDGTWRSTTSLVSTADMSPIELYMEFDKLKGRLIIRNKGDVYTAPLTASIAGGKITITQHTDATATTSADTFCKYRYVCSSDRNGNLVSHATSRTNMCEFNLVKVK